MGHQWQVNEPSSVTSGSSYSSHNKLLLAALSFECRIKSLGWWNKIGLCWGEPAPSFCGLGAYSWVMPIDCKLVRDARGQLLGDDKAKPPHRDRRLKLSRSLVTSGITVLNWRKTSQVASCWDQSPNNLHPFLMDSLMRQTFNWMYYRSNLLLRLGLDAKKI